MEDSYLYCCEFMSVDSKEKLNNVVLHVMRQSFRLVLVCVIEPRKELQCWGKSFGEGLSRFPVIWCT